LPGKHPVSCSFTKLFIGSITSSVRSPPREKSGLVPLAVNIAIGAGANPAVFALTVAIVTSNSFLIPTHQVNALIMGPARYRVADFMRAGGIMTILFIAVMILMMNLVF
jgi:di/tricarboxylate transporter